MEANLYLSKGHFDQDKLPAELNVSTISLTCHLGTNVNLSNIDQFMELDEKNICAVDYNGNYRTLIQEKKLKKKPKRKNFHNSITLKLMVRAPKVINFKIFTNGAVQIAGIKNVHEGNIAINSLVQRLSEVIGVFNESLNCIEEVRFIESDIKLSNLKINLINVNFEVDFKINRDDLYKILLAERQECYYERCKHAAVSIKYSTTDKKKPISVFVFESGAIVITGSTHEQHILKSYEFINNVLEKHKNNILKIGIDDMWQTVMKSKFSHLIVKA